MWILSPKTPSISFDVSLAHFLMRTLHICCERLNVVLLVWPTCVLALPSQPCRPVFMPTNKPTNSTSRYSMPPPSKAWLRSNFTGTTPAAASGKRQRPLSAITEPLKWTNRFSRSAQIDEKAIFSSLIGTSLVNEKKEGRYSALLKVNTYNLPRWRVNKIVTYVNPFSYLFLESSWHWALNVSDNLVK